MANPSYVFSLGRWVGIRSIKCQGSLVFVKGELSKLKTIYETYEEDARIMKKLSNTAIIKIGNLINRMHLALVSINTCSISTKIIYWTNITVAS